MNSTLHPSEELNEKQLLQTLRIAVNTSKRNLLDDGILLVSWGLAFSLGFIWKYLSSEILVASRLRDFMTVIHVIVPLVLVAFTIYFLFFRKKKYRTYTAVSTRFVWIGVIIAHNLNVVITTKFFAEVNFEMLHPLQMVLVGFALFVTGGIYRYYLLLGSGVLMWAAAVLSSGLSLHDQFLVRGISDLLCFVLPGTMMLLSRNKK